MEIIQAKNCYTTRANQEMAAGGQASSPPALDAGYVSPPMEGTPSSTYSSDYYEFSSNRITLPQEVPFSSHQMSYPFPQFPYYSHPVKYEPYTEWDHHNLGTC